MRTLPLLNETNPDIVFLPKSMVLELQDHPLMLVINVEITREREYR